MNTWKIERVIRFDETRWEAVSETTRIQLRPAESSLALPQANMNPPTAQCKAVFSRLIQSQAPVAVNAGTREWNLPTNGVPTLLRRGAGPFMTVGLRGCSAAYSIRKDHTHLDTLAEAVRNQSQLLLVTRPGTLEIEECQPRVEEPRCDGTPLPSFAPPQPVLLEPGDEQAAFDAIFAKRYALGNLQSDGIPFDFVAKGCEYRAHAACASLNAIPRWRGCVFKLLIEASKCMFIVPTCKAFGTCRAVWFYHISPAVRVRCQSTGAEETYAIDPSLFPKPVARREWEAHITSSNHIPSRITEIPINVLMRDKQNKQWRSDDDGTCSAEQLRFLRDALDFQACQFGWPPYDCA